MESSPKDKVKLLKKTAEEQTSSDSDSSLPDIECEMCGMNFPCIKSYDSHLKGKKHHKKVAEAKFLAKHRMDGVIKNGIKTNSDDDDDDESNEIHCEVCDKSFSGHISYIAHQKGKIHAKYVKKQKLREKVIDMPGVLNKDNKKNEEDDGILQSPFARCSECQKEFSGPEPFALHMKSAVHKKKVEQSKVLEILKTKHQDDSKKSDDEDDVFSNCDVCQKLFSGPVPYQIHMNSAVHKKNLEKKKVAEEMKEYYSKDETDPGYICDECKKVFTDPIAFKYHLKNNSHKKQKAKSALLGFLNSHPEIAFVTPFQDAEEENDSDSSGQDYYLICKICHVSFSGPESAEDHVKSKKHISLKKEKQAMKLLKERKQKESESVKVKEEKSPKTAVKIYKLPLNDGNSVNGKDNELHTAEDFEML